MVDKITMFEVHLDDARFGTNDTVAEEADSETSVDESTSGGGPSVAKLVVASLFVSVVATLLARRLFGDDGDGGFPIEIDDEGDAPDVEIES